MDLERVSSYLHSLEPDSSPLLQELEKAAKRERVPIIRRETGAFLRTMIAAKRPTRILEVGTGTGYSALLMAEAAGAAARITTIEKYEKRIPLAREHFRRAGKQEQITLLEGEAAQLLKTLQGPYDLIFMDASKGQYLSFLPLVLPLLPVGGVLISDNMFHDGELLESRYAVSRRDRTIHERLREYIFVCKHHPLLQSALLPLGDGVLLCTRIEEEAESKEERA